MKICFFDLDGTLLTDDKSISYRTKQSLIQLHKSGVLIGYITARTKRKITELIENLPCDFIASYDGALIECFDNDNSTKIILNECISDEIAHEIIKRLSAIPNVDVFSYFEPYHILNEKVSSNSKSSITTYNQNTTHLFSGCQRVRGRCNFTSIPQNLIGDFPDVVTYYENNDIVFRSKNVDKGAAVRCLLAHYNIFAEEAVAFGDSESDIEMFRECGISIAMGNASLATKQNATFITSSNNDDGIPRAIETIIRMGRAYGKFN